MKKKEIFKSIIIFIFLLIMLSSVILPKEINDLDELWNFNFARNIASNKIPYKDFNMVQTPFQAIVCGMVLKVTGTELLAMRIMAVVLCATILFTVYKILRELKINESVIYFFLILLFKLYKNYFCIDYNFAVLQIIMLTILIEIKNLNKLSYKKEFFIGFLAGIAIITKQTTGICFAIILIFYRLLNIYDKNKLIEEVKKVSFKILGVIIPIIIFVLYLLINNNFYDFVDYAILGMKTFTNKISYLNLIKGNYGRIIQILSIFVPIEIIYLYIKTIVIKIKNNNGHILFIFFAYSVASIVVAFPISDSIHFLIGIMPSLVALIYILYNKIIRKLSKNKITLFFKYFFTCFITILIIYVIHVSVKNISIYINEASNHTQITNLKYIKSDEEGIKRIDEFILKEESKGKKVYILDANAAVYMIPLNKYNKNYDMFLNGNLGLCGEEGQISNLKKEDNIIILILNDNYLRNWQNPEEVRKYIIENWDRTGKIQNFDMYEKRISK